MFIGDISAPPTTTLLIVDDNPADRELLVEHLRDEGYVFFLASSGVEAWELIRSKRAQIDVVLLDQVMPGMTGVELLKRLKQDPEFKTVPCILQTGITDRSVILEGIRAGAYYYIAKPVDPEMLQSVVAAAAADSAHYRLLQQTVQKGMESLSLITDATFTYRSIQQAYDLGTMLANACPDPARTVVGLTELLVNAIEHGNLGITYEEKSRLNATGAWAAEIDKRLSAPEYAAKRAEVRFEKTESEIRFTIRDEGEGFNWAPYLEVQPGRAFDTHGRGIAMANLLSFDFLEYLGAGNEVRAVVKVQC